MATDEQLNLANFYYTCNGKIVSSTPEELAAARATGLPLRAWPRLIGGKGGFGSLLRSIGSQIDKTTNKEMCRDLSGRRMRDVNNQKRLSDWATGAAARAAERQKRREEKRQRRRQLLAAADGPTGHVMEDGSYRVEQERIVDSVFTAVKEVLVSKKRPAPEATSSTAAGPSKPAKAAKKWLDADLAELEGNSSSGSSNDGSSSSSSSDTDDDEASAPCQNAAEATEAQAEATEATEAQAEATEAQAEATEAQAEATEATETEPTSTVEDSTERTAVAEEKSKSAAPVAEAATAAPEATIELIDLSSIDSLEAMESLGFNGLKEQLRMRGLKCGGNLRDRAERLWSVRCLQPEQYPAALLARPAHNKK